MPLKTFKECCILFCSSFDIIKSTFIIFPLSLLFTLFWPDCDEKQAIDLWFICRTPQPAGYMLIVQKEIDEFQDNVFLILFLKSTEMSTY